MSVRMKGQLPKGDLDGLQALAQQIDDDPERVIVAVVLLKAHSITVNLDSETNPRDLNLHLLHIEPMGADLDEQAAESFLRAAYEKRTGKPLPFGSFLQDAAADTPGDDGEPSAVGPTDEEIGEFLDSQPGGDGGDSDPGGDDGPET